MAEEWPLYILPSRRRQSKQEGPEVGGVKKVSPNLPFEYYMLHGIAFEGRVVCRLGSKLVREQVRDSEGGLYRFVGLASRDASGQLDVASLAPGEWIVEPDLIYVYEVHAADAA